MVNELCKDCLIFHRYKEGCWVHWEGKKFCTMKVLTDQQWEEQKNIIKQPKSKA
jgi:hypothetical protein